MEKKAAILTIFGKVQGVGFRFYTHRKANELDISGFVNNQPDGSVYIEAEGISDRLEQFIYWCEDGPSWARVAKVERQDVPVTGYKEFSIK